MAKKAKYVWGAENAIVILHASNYPTGKETIRIKANREMAEKAKFGWDYTEEGNSALASLAYKAESSPSNPLRRRKHRVYPWKLRVIEIIPLKDEEKEAFTSGSKSLGSKEKPSFSQDSLFDSGKYIRNPWFSS